MLIDDAIVDVENVMRQAAAGRSRGGERQIDRESSCSRRALEIRSPLLYAMLILLLAVTPSSSWRVCSAPFFRRWRSRMCLAAACVHAGCVDGHTGAVPDSLANAPGASGREPRLVGWLQTDL